MALRIGLIGCGAIGQAIAEAVERGEAGKAEIVAIHDQLPEAARRLILRLRRRPRYFDDGSALCRYGRVKLVLEAASQAAARKFLPLALKAGKSVMVMSVGVFADSGFYKELVRMAREKGSRILIPTGAIAGLDALKAASLEGLTRVVLRTRKPPEAWKGAPYLEMKGIRIERISSPTMLFEGPAGEAAPLFPANINVAVALSLAGVGVEKTMVQIVADPGIERNIHEIEAEGKFGSLKVTVENVPSPTNPKTSWLAALSAIRKLREETETVSLGT